MKYAPADAVDARKRNIQNSPKKGGSGDIDSQPYLRQMGVKMTDRKQPIQFTPNVNEMIHRWAPYVQGFSASFVQSIFDKYKGEYNQPKILDPFAGCGTVLVQAKLNKYKSVGVELNPLLAFISRVKLNSWGVKPETLMAMFETMPSDRLSKAPAFLKSEAHFDYGALRNLEILRGGMEALKAHTEKHQKAIDLIKVAFSSILIESSKLKRTPCLGYHKGKVVEESAPAVLLRQKIYQMMDDLHIISSFYRDCVNVRADIITANSMTYKHRDKFDLVITSPPYMNGLDYVMNYKIEMGWIGFAQSQKDLKKIKDAMVVCDNVSKGLIKRFELQRRLYSNTWIESIKTAIDANIQRRGAYRRNDMAFIVHKYFNDLYQVMRNVRRRVKTNGRFILVVGDSLIADTYVPTDLIIAKIGAELGFEIESIEKARSRRSGQIRSYKLRESIITLKAPGCQRET